MLLTYIYYLYTNYGPTLAWPPSYKVNQFVTSLFWIKQSFSQFDPPGFHLNKYKRIFLIILANFVVVLTYSLVEIISSKWNNDGIQNLDLIQKVLTLVQDPPGNVNDYFSDFAFRSVLKGNNNVLTNQRPGALESNTSERSI